MTKLSDSASFANFNEAIVYHADLELKVDFNQKRIDGSVILRLKGVQNTHQVILDTRKLDIIGCYIVKKPVAYKLIDHGVLGNALLINLPNELKVNYVTDVQIIYSTVNASALQFIDKELTGDKSQPFLYSQCQAIHARSIVPCMDTPAVKQTYSARVHVPTGITCLMSAIGYGIDDVVNLRLSEWHSLTRYRKCFDKHDFSTAGYTAFLFHQPIKMASYLFAIVGGDLEKRNISDRCAIWAESCMIDKAFAEFQDTETMLSTAEDLLGPYAWKRYDLVVLPPFFPFGGMENPCLTFVTPTIIAGDRSLTNVIAHEIAHSWTGNLVTNGNWEHFWLNEGFTVFVERKIMGRIYGEKFRQFENVCGWEDRMIPVIKETFHPTHEFTKLCPNLQGIDPDDAYSTIPYEKGSALLLVLEQKLGDIPRFEKFLKDYIAHFAGQSIVTDDWKQYLYKAFADKQDILDQMDWNGWLMQPGLPPDTPSFDDSSLVECRELADIWINGSDDVIAKLDPMQFKKLTSVMKVKILDCIESNEEPLSKSRILTLISKYDLTKSGNCEILFSFILIALKSKVKELIPFTINFACQQGRLKYVKPIFTKLFKWDFTRELAIKKFHDNVPFMHPITAQVIESLIPK